MKRHQIVFAIVQFVGALALASCGAAQRPNKTVLVCLSSPIEAETAVSTLKAVADSNGYRFREYGLESKANLEIIDANPLLIPEGRPIQADIARDDGTVLVIASNFGGPNENLRVSFFYDGAEGENSPFFRELEAEISSAFQVVECGIGGSTP